MKVSVIVPVHNVAPYLEQCIESILAQTFTDFELLLVDDKSTDASGIICDQFAQAHPPSSGDSFGRTARGLRGAQYGGAQCSG